MRRGRRARRRDGIRDDLARHGAGPERTDRAPGVQRLQRRLAEQVVGGRAHEVARPAPAGAPSHATPRTSATGTRVGLAHHHAGCRRHLIGERHDRRPPARARRGPACREGRRSAGIPATPIATSTSPSRHGRPNVSVITTPRRSSPSATRASRADALGGAVGVLGQQREEPVRDVGGVHPGVRADEPVRASRRSRDRRDGRPPARSPRRRRRRASRPSDDAALRLRHHLLGDDDDVALGGRRVGASGVREQRREVVAGRDLGQALDGLTVSVTRAAPGRRAPRPPRARRPS